MIGIYRSLIILLVVMIGLSGCITKIISEKNARDRVQCLERCEERLKNCSGLCHNNCHECSNKNHSATAQHYYRWVHEQVVQGGMVSRELNSYRDPLQCRKTTCNCQADYTVCNAACSGNIRKRLQVGPACC